MMIIVTQITWHHKTGNIIIYKWKTSFWKPFFFIKMCWISDGMCMDDIIHIYWIQYLTYFWRCMWIYVHWLLFFKRLAGTSQDHIFELITRRVKHISVNHVSLCKTLKKNEKVQLCFLLARVKNLELKGRPNVCVQIVCTDKCNGCLQRS